MTKSDLQLKQDVEAELLWEPKVNAAHICVTVDEGAVSLLGFVDSYAEKWTAEDATKRVGGVRTVAQDLTVKVLADHERSDSDIALAVQSSLYLHIDVPNAITAYVREGWVTLSGDATWNHERDAAERAVRYLAGIVGVTNLIAIKAIKPDACAEQAKEQIEAALQRQATTDAKSIHVHTSGGKVTLSGHASSWQSIDDAAHAAWAASGVTDVVDHVKRWMTN